MQHTVIYAGEPRGLPLNEKIMPQYFNELGYGKVYNILLKYIIFKSYYNFL